MYNSRITNPVSEKMVYDADGHQIVNLYDAAGRKYKSIVYTNLATTATPYYDIAQYSFDIDTIWYNVTEYAGNIENRYTRTDTAQRIFNTTGYYAGGVYYHYIKDHVGNINAVVNSVADTSVQSTIYYASGVPMVESKGIPYQYYNAYGVQPNQNFGRDEQPYLYNGKEFIEAHGLNEYDSQARMYYAPIMRTTTMDPLAEKYYHISPYAWCGNNTIRNIDINGKRPLPIDMYYNHWYAKVDSWFGYRNTGLKGASIMHKGLDFNYSCGGDGDYGSPIYATHEGYARVINNNESKAGRYVEIVSEDGRVKTRYLHLSAVSIEDGQYVSEADKIGEMGGSANGQEHRWTSHLHYEIHVKSNGEWKATNPVGDNENEMQNIIDPQEMIDVDNNIYMGGSLEEIIVYGSFLYDKR